MRPLHERVPHAVLLGILVVAYFGAAKGGLVLAFQNESVTAVWPPTGLALAAVLLWGRRVWPAVALGALLANLTTDAPLGSVMGITVGNTLEAVVGAALLTRVGFRPSLERVRDVLALVGLAAVTSTMISATIGVVSLWLGGAVAGGALADTWRTWWLGDLSGDLLVAAPLLVAFAHRRTLAAGGAAVEAAVSLAAVVGVGLLVFIAEVPLSYLVFPPVFWAAFRFRQLGAVAAGLLLAAIGIYFTARGHGPFTMGSRDASLVSSQAFADVAVVTALLVAAVRTEWLRAESERGAAVLAANALRDSKALLAEAQRIGGFGSWEWDLATGEIRWSEELHRLTGVPVGAFEESYDAAMAVVHPDDRAVVEGHLQRTVEERGSFSFEHRILRADGELRILHATGEVMCDAAGAPTRLQGTAQDVTARRRAEDTFRQLLEAAPDAMVIVNEQGEIMLVNAQAEELFGYAREELLGQPVERLVPPRLRGRHEAHRKGFSHVPSTRPMGRELELFALHKDGRELPVEVSLSPLETEDGTLVLSAIRDISDRNASERRIRDSAARMAEAQEIARFGSWEWSPVTGEVTWSDLLYEIYGLTPEEFTPNFEAYLGRVHEADRDRVAGAVSAALAAKQPFAFEERIVLPDGEVRLLRSQGRPMLDERGDVVRMIGVCQDITELREAEQARREAEARFRNAFENAPIGVALVELESGGPGRFLDVNRSLCRITGYTEEELLRLGPDDLTDPRDLAADRMLRDRLLGGAVETYTTELRCLHADGRPIWALVSASLVRDADDTPGYAIVQLQDISERKRFEGQLQYLADHDPLTGLANRRRFLEELDLRVAHHARYGGEGAVVVLDLDHFKYVNDTLGHAVGDDLVRRVGALLRERLRETDMVARLGGDEFAVLLPEVDADRAREVAGDLLKEIRSRAVVVSAGRRIRISASIGVALFGQEPDLTGEVVLVNADIAMYQAKEGGRNRVALLETLEEPKTQMRARMTWLERVRAALDNDRFTLYAQPIVGLQGGGEPRYELLVRMLGDQGGAIPPGAFLPIAEEFGLIQAIDAWVVRRAIALAAERESAGEPVVLEVNLSGVSLTDAGVLDVIESELAASGVDASRLIFEVTETAAIVNIEKANRFAERLGSLGCGFALDDFGAGFGSFYYLKHLPFDYLKIDGDFVRNLPQSEPDRLTVQAIVQIAQGLGKKTIAEFVGDEQTMELLRGYGVDYAQGYHLGRPAPAELCMATAP